MDTESEWSRTGIVCFVEEGELLCLISTLNIFIKATSTRHTHTQSPRTRRRIKRILMIFKYLFLQQIISILFVTRPNEENTVFRATQIISVESKVASG